LSYCGKVTFYDGNLGKLVETGLVLGEC
jgi:hypothetical protein